MYDMPTMKQIIRNEHKTAYKECARNEHKTAYKECREFCLKLCLFI